MKIIHININYTGSALHQTMVEYLKQFDIWNEVFVPTYDVKSSIVDINEYVTLSKCFNKWDRVLYFYKQKKIISSLLETYDVNKYDCIHAYTLFSDGNAAMNLAKQFNKPFVVAVRNTDVNTFFKKRIFLRSHGIKILRNARAIFFLSPTYKRTVIDKYVPLKYRQEITEKSYVIPNGIDAFWLKNRYFKNLDEAEKRLKKRELECIYVGNIDSNKNIELTLKALSEMNDDGWKCKLTVIGKIVSKKVFLKLKKYQNFNYITPQKKEMLISYLRNADVFIMVSHNETFGLVYAEAMSQGLPVIYTRGQGFDEQFKDGYVGYAASDIDYKDVISAIIKISERYSEISEHCSNSCMKFDWAMIVKEYFDIYHSIIKYN